MVGRAYLQGEQRWNDVQLQPDGADLCDPVGGLQQQRVVGSWRLLLVEDLPLVDVLLGERGWYLEVLLFPWFVMVPLSVPGLDLLKDAQRRRPLDHKHDL